MCIILSLSSNEPATTSASDLGTNYLHLNNLAHRTFLVLSNVFGPSTSRSMKTSVILIDVVLIPVDPDLGYGSPIAEVHTW